ncbi:MAG: SLC13 family permease [Bradyrhizobiaceae bacterium]|nr:MAG: SLC13 family permease [Bradyrhizobiaceae bacterium]
MSRDQIVVLAVLAATVGAFLWGRWRHDMVAMGALLACVIAGLVPAGEAFAGFGHPAVVTVACVLVLSRGLQTSGAVDGLTRLALPQGSGALATTAILTGVAALLSAFMNNVGALALLMPVAIQIAQRQKLPPGKLLMPLAFGSILGGMTTLIGTPPNLIVSGFRASSGGGSFAMFDFAPVGLAVAACGIAFLVLFAWRLVPARERAGTEEFETGAYLTEARVPDGAKAAGMRLHEIEQALDEADAQIVGLIRHEVRVPAPEAWHRVQAGDILVIEAEPKALASALSALDLTLEEAVQDDAADETAPEESSRQSDGSDAAKGGETRSAERSGEIALMELAVLPNSTLVGRSASGIRLRTRFGVNLLAISREGRRTISRLRTAPIFAGDVLLMQGAPEAISEFAAQFGCVPLAERTLRLPDKRQALTAGAIMAAAVGGAAFGLVPAAIAFAAGVLAAMVLRVVPPRNVYDAVDWPVVVLLGALIPVAGAMATTGAADLLASALLDTVARGNAVIALGAILIVAMTLSDFMNNAATAAVMCPIAIGAAASLGVSADPFLMAVAVGSSCAFLTPIGHQNNTLILGPSGFRFGDYWRLGLPLEIIVVAVGVPVLLLVWPL